MRTASPKAAHHGENERYRRRDVWRGWRTRRYRELILSGVPTNLAKRFAGLEALGRANAALIVGVEAAKSGQLVLAETEDGAIRFFLRSRIEGEESAVRTSSPSAVSTDEKAH